MSYGQESGISISFQNSYGTSLTTSRYWLPFISEGFSLKKEQKIENNMYGRFDESPPYEGFTALDAPLTCEMHPVAGGAILKAFFGAPTTTTSAAVYSHLFKPATSDFDIYAAKRPITFTKTMGDGGSSHLFYDCVPSKLSFKIGNGELVNLSMDVIGASYSQVAAVTPSLPTGRSTWTWDVASVSMGGSAQVGVRDMDITITEGIDRKYCLNSGGTKTPQRIKRTSQRTVEIAGTLTFDNQNEYQQFIAQSERELILNFKGTTQIQSGYYETLTIKCPGMRYSEFPLDIGGPEEIEVAFKAKGVYSTTSATAIQVTLVNTQPTY